MDDCVALTALRHPASHGRKPSYLNTRPSIEVVHDSGLHRSEGSALAAG